MIKTKIYWNSKPVGIIENIKTDNFRLYGKWIPYRSIAHLEFVELLETNPEPRLHIGEENSDLNGILLDISKNEIEINIGL